MTLLIRRVDIGSRIEVFSKLIRKYSYFRYLGTILNNRFDL